VTALPVAPTTLAAMEAALAMVPDMAAFSRGIFTRFLALHPGEAVRFLNLAAAVLRMTDQSFVLLLGLAGGEGWAAGSAAHWADLHRNYGPIGDALYAEWTALCLAELEQASGAAWPASAAGWQAAAAELTRLLIAANQGISQPACHGAPA
jgi:hypothetical protein